MFELAISMKIIQNILSSYFFNNYALTIHLAFYLYEMLVGFPNYQQFMGNVTKNENFPYTEFWNF